VDLEELKRIIRLLKEEDLTEITVAEGDTRVTVRREVAVVGAASPQPGGGTAQPSAEDDGTFMVTAPLIGTFYARPAPDAAPYVEPGAEVAPGDTLCAIEAMKVLNEIKAESPGRLKRVLVEDGESVEYGTPLFQFEKE